MSDKLTVKVSPLTIIPPYRKGWTGIVESITALIVIACVVAFDAGATWFKVWNHILPILWSCAVADSYAVRRYAKQCDYWLRFPAGPSKRDGAA